MCYRLLSKLIDFPDLELESILLNEGRLAEEIRKLGIPVTIADETRLNPIQLIGNIRNILRNSSPKIIHSHRRKENILAYLSSRFDPKIIRVCTQHGMPEPLRSGLKIIQHVLLSKYNLHILLRHFSYIITVSDDIRNKIIREYGFDENKVTLIHNGTDMPNVPSISKDGNKFVIGSAGRFFAIKDYRLMVEIANEIVRQSNNISFRLAGEGPEEKEIIRIIRDYNLENSFNLAGFVHNIEAFYRSLDLYINTSIHEGLPMSVLEAMAHGLPVVAPKVGGLPEILANGVQGYLIDKRDPKAFAEKCIEIYRNRELARRMGTASRERIRDAFSIENMANEHHNLYGEIARTC